MKGNWGTKPDIAPNPPSKKPQKQFTNLYKIKTSFYHFGYMGQTGHLNNRTLRGKQKPCDKPKGQYQVQSSCLQALFLEDTKEPPPGKPGNLDQYIFHGFYQ